MSKRVLVCVKRVVDYAVKIRVNPDGSGIEKANVKMGLNPFCEIALEEAVRLKERKTMDIKDIVVLSIGPKETKEMIRGALAFGCDSGIHIQTDLGLDQQLQPLMTAKILSHFIQKQAFDIVFMGKQSIDSDYNQVPQLTAGILGWPQATYASAVNYKDPVMEVEREIDGGRQTLNFNLPGIISCDLRLNTPRFAKLPDIMKAKKKAIETIDLSKVEGLDLQPKLEIIEITAPPTRSGGTIVESVDVLLNNLRTKDRIID